MPLKDKEAHRAYCRAYYYAHSGKGRKRRPRRTREEILARKRAYSVKYRQENKEKIRAYKARPEVRAGHNAYNRLWRETNHEKHLEYMRKYMRKYMAGHRRPRIPLTDEQIRERHEQTKANRRKWYHDNIEYCQLAAFMYRLRCAEREKVDAAYYARKRELMREQNRRRRERAGKTYKPKPSMRIPDWCVRGGGVGRAEQMAVGERHRRATGVCAGAGNRAQGTEG